MVESTEESSLIIGDLDLDTVEDDELFKLLKVRYMQIKFLSQKNDHFFHIIVHIKVVNAPL